MLTLSDALKLILHRQSRTHLWRLVEFPTVYSSGSTPLRVTNFHRSFVWAAKTWITLPEMEVDGVTENLELKAPEASIRLTSLDATFQQKFLLDQFRGTKVQFTVISQEPGTSIADAVQIRTMRYTCNVDDDDENGVNLKLSSADAVQGTEVPRRTCSEFGCQWDFQREGCPYRGHMEYSLAANGTLISGSLRQVVLTTCDKTIEDCRKHFPPVLNPNWSTTNNASRTIRRPLFYSAFPGDIPGRIVI